MATKSELIYNYVSKKIAKLEYNSENHINTGLMPLLRREFNNYTSDNIDFLSFIYEDMPEELINSDKVSDAEKAIMAAISLYALHKQANDDPHKKNVTVGQAAFQYVINSSDVDKEKRKMIDRLKQLCQAQNVEDAALIFFRYIHPYIAKRSIGLDYARLAKELYQFKIEEYRRTIVMKWAKDFYFGGKKK